MDTEKMEFATTYYVNVVDKRLSAEIKENRDHIDEHSKEIARLEAVYKSLEDLPNTIANLDKTMALIGGRLESMEANVEETKESVLYQNKVIQDLKGENKSQNENIERIDNKSKIDWQELITKNFWKVLCILFGGYAIISTFLERGA